MNPHEDLHVKFKFLVAMQQVLVTLQNFGITICFQTVWNPSLILNVLV